MNSQYSKAQNKASIFRQVCINGTISRLELHRRTGLSKMTVTNLVGEFIEAGIMRQCGYEGNGVGRKTELIEVVPDAAVTIGIMITHHGLYVAPVALDGSYSELWECQLNPNETTDSFYQKIYTGIDHIIGGGGRFAGIAVSSLGCVDTQNNILELEFFLPRVGRVTDLNERLGKKYGLPVFAENDSNVSALAELYYGENPPENFIYVQVDEGVGTGLVVGGALFSTKHSFTGEIGHMTIENGGLPCKCGNFGCLERYASTQAACEWYSAYRGIHKVSWDELIEYARSGDDIAMAAMSRMGRYLTSGLVNLINVVDVDCIYIGDRGTELLNMSSWPIEAEINQRKFLHKNVRVCPATFSLDARIRGAAPLMIEHQGDVSTMEIFKSEENAM